MEPKFQSSFIPKGPVVSNAPGPQKIYRRKEHNFFSFVATVIFILSIVAAAGVFGYRYYLTYRISKMGVELEQAQNTLKPDLIKELIRLDTRLNSTASILGRHQILSPVFNFLELSTPSTVRFTSFTYVVTAQGIELSMLGEARGYTALAFQAGIFDDNEYFKDTVFSDFELTDEGDVAFSLRTIIDPQMVSYQKEIEGLNLPPAIPDASDTSTTTDGTGSSELIGGEPLGPAPF